MSSIRILVAKPGLDGHDVGAKVVARALMNAGFEVIYTGLRCTSQEIASIARDEDVDVIGLSILSGSHIPFCRRFSQMREEYQIADKLWLVGGNISKQDIAELMTLGVNGVFPAGSSLQSVVDFINEKVRCA